MGEGAGTEWIWSTFIFPHWRVSQWGKIKNQLFYTTRHATASFIQRRFHAVARIGGSCTQHAGPPPSCGDCEPPMELCGAGSPSHPRMASGRCKRERLTSRLASCVSTVPPDACCRARSPQAQAQRPPPQKTTAIASGFVEPVACKPRRPVDTGRCRGGVHQSTTPKRVAYIARGGQFRWQFASNSMQFGHFFGNSGCRGNPKMRERRQFIPHLATLYNTRKVRGTSSAHKPALT